MDRSNDPWGQSIMECWRNGAGSGVVYDVKETPDGYVEFDDSSRFFQPFEQWPQVQRWACERVNGSVLDVGAGGGRHSVHLQNEGHSVTALDTSELALQVCGERGVQDTFCGTLDDMAATGRRFDTVLFLGYNFSFVGRPTNVTRFVAMVKGLLGGDGRVVLDGFDPYKKASRRPRRSASARAVDVVSHPGERTFRVRFREAVGEWGEYLFLNLPELHAALEGSSLEVKDTYEAGDQYAAVLERGTVSLV